jgi:hypothetical protein
MSNIILDAVDIHLCIITICKTFRFILLILIRRCLIKSKDTVRFLLDVLISMLVIGHFAPTFHYGLQ